MRKNAKKILVGAVLILTLAIFTACGSSNNNADEVELFVNGESQGVRTKGKDDFHVVWRVK